jgi:cytochrome c556
MMRAFGILLFAGIAGLALAQGPGYHEVANTQQLMQGMIQPAMNAINDAAKDQGPQDNRAWRVVLTNAVMLQESAQLLKTSGRAKDQDGWVKASDVLADAGAAVQRAAQAKDIGALQSASSGIGGSCQGCHSVYRQRGQKKEAPKQ